MITDNETADQLIEILLDKNRVVPVFVLSLAEGQQAPSLDANALSRALLGLALVTVVPAPLTWLITNRLGQKRSVFGGAARAYMPGFSADADPYLHRLELAERLSDAEGAARCQRWMRLLAASSSLRRLDLDHQVLSFTTIHSAVLKLRQSSLKQGGASAAEQLEAATLRIAALETAIDEDREYLTFCDQEIQKAEQRAAAAEEKLRAARFRIQQLESLPSVSASSGKREPLPTTWPGLADWCEIDLAGRLVLTPLALRAIRSSPAFRDVELVARCLRWLAHESRDRRMEGGSGSLRDVQLEAGVRNAPCGSDEFDVSWEGRTHSVDWHVKTGGNTRDPTRCLRIYYFWDPSSNVIVVADLPAHRETGAS